MTATVPTQRKRRAQAAPTGEKKARFYDPRVGRMSWKLPSEMTPDEREWAKLPAVAQPVVAGRYADKLRLFKAGLERAEEQRRYAVTEEQIEQHDEAIGQFRLAIKLYEEAEQTPSIKRQFGTPFAKEWQTRIPPTIKDFANDPNALLQAHNYRLITSEPVALVVLRRLVARGAIEGLEEMEPGLCPSIGPAGDCAGWVTPEFYLGQLRANQIRPW